MDDRAANSQPCARVAVVTVTYGARWHLLSQLLARAEADINVVRVIVVDNGSSPPIAQCLDEFDVPGRDQIEVVALGKNYGSAVGFATGLGRAARLDNITHVMLLDDDNIPERGCIDSLLMVSRLSGATGSVVVSALRKGRTEYEEILRGERTQQLVPNSFLGFHVRDLPGKVLKRLRRTPTNPTVTGATSRIRELEVAPYGGLLIPFEALSRVELPRVDYVLYSDDHEFTWRFRQAGILLLLTDYGLIRDAEVSWNKEPESNPWVSRGAPGWRVYYSCRNRVIFERDTTDKGVWYSANRSLYLVILACLAIKEHGPSRDAVASFRPLIDALRDARNGVTGERAPYNLP